jgi:hypothetical protein
LKILRARFLAEFTLSGRARFLHFVQDRLFASLRMTSEGFGMTVQRKYSHRRVGERLARAELFDGLPMSRIRSSLKNSARGAGGSL